jgi:hypothetical protein
MVQRDKPYVHIKRALTDKDIEYLKAACRRHVLTSGIPCYALINALESETFIKIRRAVDDQLNEFPYYLNDFYMYTDASFRTNWHMDTELFTFSRAVNAWVLLSPASVTDPLAFIDGINDSAAHQYHSVSMKNDQCIFANYSTGDTLSRSLAALDGEQLHTPQINLGDILLFDPGRFHKTNSMVAKHIISLKFLLKDPNGFLSSRQVDAHFWPEVALFTDLVKSAPTWNEVINGIRSRLHTDEGREALSSGFYPEKFDLYKRMVTEL